ncbi:MAG: RnfABCDGE type electron transport complex subunit D [Candidatus Cloacimonetes bacterium]|nr:RnfABCDGE type electron transport complex subunit D [Candidatus Cloacimonadota bacterium]MCF7813226.1 RnfABCDGE type electron transport complex subunit D [Candidatus Cloacimonadota bacterium]MCF7867425.1 RnfABCDGE type electron transport complex subunit D [Candidatus Cloacimonadota bacterium]MCF7882943.1 RnfABCDGE type electron transport complex subunit D [Candidatus Cloacimonadota bacterium]
MSEVYAVSAAPHIKQKISVSSVMWQVVIALIPALLAGIFFFGIQSLLLTLYAVVAAVVTEALIQRLRNVPISVSDGSAVVTGILVAFNINVASPWWLPVAGSVFAIAVGKQIFGGLGFNIFNPALLGRAFLVASWPTLTTAGWTKTMPLNGIFESSINGLKALPSNIPDVITSATPLGVAKALRDTTQISRDMAETVMNNLASTDTIQNIFWGNIGGCIGEISAAALLIGAAYLAYKHIIEWRIPISYIGTVFVLIYIFGGINGLFSASIMLPIFHIFSGGLILGAFFMATDMVTSPVTKRGRIIFGIGCGVLTVVIRMVGGYPEGVSYSILLMNIAVPLIDRYTGPKIFGEVKK